MNQLFKLTATVFVLIFVASMFSCTQKKQSTTSHYLSMRWKDVATKMDDSWYGSNEAKLVAEQVLLSQKAIGGWEKNKDYHKPFSAIEREHYTNDKNDVGATFDNGATIVELRFLAKVYEHHKNERYKAAFEKGLHYIFIAQYDNGGWPQFYPVRGSVVDYSGHITYNDDAMVNTMRFLHEIILNDSAYAALALTNEIKQKAQNAFDKGVKCIINTQIVIDGEPTVWCAQHDKITLAPAKARSYELVSFSGAESASIVLLLMDIDQPSNEVIASVKGAVQWFEKNKIEGIKLETQLLENGKKNRIVVKDENASPLWARFYDIQSSEPFFCDRDGVKKQNFEDLGFERRNGYGWFTNKPLKVLKHYPVWLSTL